MKVLLRSSLWNGTERGEDSFELITTLIRLGAEVYLVPTEVRPPLPTIAASLLSRVYPPVFDLALHYVDPADAEIPREFRDAANMNVLWTKHPQTMFNKRLTPSVNEYDAILAQDEVTYTALSEITSNPLGVLAAGFNSEPWQPARRTWDGPVNFCMVLTGDKGEYPELAIEAFHTLRSGTPHDRTENGFEEFAESQLVIKTLPGDDLNPKLTEHVPGLTIIKENWSKEVFNKFYGDMHVMLSPDRGGKRNKACMEFMSTGGVVIATDWSLNRAWLSGAYGYPLEFDYNIVSHKDSRNKFANPSGYHLRERMLEIAQNPQAAADRGQIASNVVPTMLDWNKVLESMFQMLDELSPDEGTNLYDKYKRCTPLREETTPWTK